MSLLTFSSPPSKGSVSSATLDKTVVMALPSISVDQFWGVSSNIKTAIVVYSSLEGSQDKLLRFDFAQSAPTAALALSNKARDTFYISMIISKDFDGGEIAVHRKELLTAISSLASLDLDLS